MNASPRPDERLFRPSRFVVAAVLVALAAPPCASEIYQWVDERGTIHFTDELAAVPPGSRGKARLLLREAPVTVEAPPPESYAPLPGSASESEPAIEAGDGDAEDPATRAELLRAKITAKEKLIENVDAKRSLATNPLRNRVVSPADMDLYRKYKAELPGDRERLKELESRIDTLSR